ncbi:hypothetical protein [Halobaculum gomorrense]|uniref:Uncharacterized protein n=1 Tax=Halobaculum gomorrense TaxID=43928 RepID=A0A1M5N1P7_9EURY|nr:hypothetical protein [Halobaculum gomorrense]SHG83375.1 hypothetical protein SAMN05443636_1227 [Halobaculum gomorrense]
MTRAAVEEGFERFVEDAVRATYEEFSVVNALRGGNRPPGVTERLLKRNELLERRVVRPELDDYRDRVLAEFHAALDAVESEEPFEAHRDRILAHDAYALAMRSDLSDDRSEEIRDALLARQRRLVEDVEPLLDSDEDDFWNALADVFTVDRALRFVDERFEFTEPMARYPDAFRLAVTIDPGELLGGVGGLLAGGLPEMRVEFTDEARRAMRRAETRVREETTREVRRRL